jgi:hypothetical protein
LVNWCLPWPQGTSSTTTAWQRRQGEAPHGVQEEDQEAPERDEFETPLGELIVTGGRLVATGTDRRGTFARADSDFNTSVIGTEAGLLINEAWEMMAVI